MALKAWLAGRGSEPHSIDSGVPWRNAHGESFNGRLRDGGLDLEVFTNRHEADVVTKVSPHRTNPEPHMEYDA